MNKIEMVSRSHAGKALGRAIKADNLPTIDAIVNSMMFTGFVTLTKDDVASVAFNVSGIDAENFTKLMHRVYGGG